MWQRFHLNDALKEQGVSFGFFAAKWTMYKDAKTSCGDFFPAIEWKIRYW